MGISSLSKKSQRLVKCDGAFFVNSKTIELLFCITPMPAKPLTAIKTVQKVNTNGMDSVGSAYLPKKEVRLTLITMQSIQAAANQSQKGKLKL